MMSNGKKEGNNDHNNESKDRIMKERNIDQKKQKKNNPK